MCGKICKLCTKIVQMTMTLKKKYIKGFYTVLKIELPVRTLFRINFNINLDGLKHFFVISRDLILRL